MFGLIGSLISGVLSPLTTYLTRRQDVDLAKFQSLNETERAEYSAYLEALIQSNNVKASANSWLGARIMVYVFGLPAAIHWGAVFIVSTIPPQWGFDITIPALPSAYAGAEQTIALSFFILAPTLPLVSAARAWIYPRSR